LNPKLTLATGMTSANLLVEPVEDGLFQLDTIITERMIRRDFEMEGLGVSFLFECLQQRFAVRPGTITRESQEQALRSPIRYDGQKSLRAMVC
jgi:hypothetical protein